MRAIEETGASRLALGDQGHGVVRVCLLGGLRIEKGDGILTAQPESKMGLLIRRLALAGRSGVPRAELLELLWGGGEGDDRRAESCLATLIAELRQVLRGSPGGAPAVLNGDGGYRLNLAGGLAVDVDDFDAAVDRGHRAHGEREEARALAAYAAALDLYQGDLCVGRGAWDELHAYVEQERLRSRCMTVLGRVAALADRAGDLDLAMAYARRLVSMDPCSEIGHRRIMSLYALRGLRAQALRQYRVCAEALRREYETTPEPATAALFDRIRTGQQWTVPDLERPED